VTSATGDAAEDGERGEGEHEALHGWEILPVWTASAIPCLRV
jgi:hypothetical protein